MKFFRTIKTRLLGLTLCAFLLGASTAKSQYFAKKIGTEADEEGATAIIQIDNSSLAIDGYMLIAGYHGDKSVLVLMSPEGQVQWETEFKLSASGKRDIIHDLEYDGTHVVGCGYGLDKSGNDDDAFLFQFSLTTLQMNWDYIDQSTLETRFLSVTVMGGKYIVTGNRQPSSMVGTDGYLEAFNPGLGTTIGAPIVLRTGTQSDDFLFAEDKGLNLYFGGRIYQTTSSLCQSRAMMSSIDPLAGTYNWASTYHETPTTDRRMYGQDLTIDGNHLVLAASGTQTTTNGCNASDYAIFLAKTDLLGGLQTTRAITINGYQTVVPREVFPYDDGYFVMGQAIDNGISDFFLMFVDQNLNEIWTRTYGGDLNDNFIINSNNQMFVDADNSAVYFVGRSKSLGISGSWDMAVYKTSMGGDIGSKCQTVVDAPDAAGNNVQTPFGWGTQDLPIVTSRAYAEVISPSIPDELVCGCIPEIASHGPKRPVEVNESELDPEKDMDRHHLVSAELGSAGQDLVRLQVFPNPVKETIQFSLNGPTPVTQITITNVTGQVVLIQELSEAEGSNLDVSTLKNGIYLAKVSTADGQSYEASFIKEN